MRVIAPNTRAREYNVFWHWRDEPDNQFYNLEVKATNVERAISKVKRESLEEVADRTRRDIVIDHIELR